MNRIVLINQSSGHISYDLLKEFIKFYKSCTLITGLPDSVPDKLATEIKIEKIKPFNKSSYLKRIVSWIVATFQIAWLIKSKYRTDYLFIVSNPPFAPLIPIICKNKFSILIFDIFPDVIVNYKILTSNSFIIKIWEKANRRVFQKADNVFTISENMGKILGNYTGLEKIRVVPLWHNSDFTRLIDQDKNLFIKSHKLEGKFVVMYSGNIGLTHNVEILLDLAYIISDPNIVFIIIGDGMKRKSLEIRARELDLSNIIFLNYQPLDLLAHSLGSASLGFVTLDNASSNLSVPSKTFNLIACGVPIIAIADQESELNRIIVEFNIGMCFRPDQILQMKAYIIELVTNKALHSFYRHNTLIAKQAFSPENVNFITKRLNLLNENNEVPIN